MTATRIAIFGALFANAAEGLPDHFATDIETAAQKSTSAAANP